MAVKRRRVEGCEYLYELGRSYEVRLQVPRNLHAIVGKTELKKSLGRDFDKAKRTYHAKVAEYQRVIDRARNSQKGCGDPTPSHSEPTCEQIDRAAYTYFEQRVSALRGKNVSPTGRKAASRQERLNGFHEMINHLVDLADITGAEVMSTDAMWLCEDEGWTIEIGSARFEYLCETLLRARLQAYKAEASRLEGRFYPDPHPDPMFDLRAPRKSREPLTLAHLRERFEAEREERWSASTKKNYAIIFKVLEEICGSTTLVSSIDRDFCRDVKRQLLLLPASYQKCPATRGKSILDAIAISGRLEMRTISPATVNNHLNKLGAIVRFGRDQGWITGNPMANIEVPDPIDPSEKRDPFTIDQLNLLFAHHPWTDGLATIERRPSRYWAPLISLFSGARLTEVCGQRTDEMIVEEGVLMFHFVHRPNDRHIKGGKSRKVPVHPELIRLGFWDFVEAASASKQDHLFSDVKRDKLGKWGDHTTKWFTRQVKSLGLKGRNLSFHSFRHSFEDALRRADLHDTPLGNALTGRWTAGVSKNYGSRYPVAKLYEAMAMVSYPGLIVPKQQAVASSEEHLGS